MDKLYDRIIFENGTVPALNDTNLNAMSKALDDIDDRVILLADDVLVVIPQIQAYLAQADTLVEALETLSQNPPYIGANGNWYVFDTSTEQYVDSGVDASITVDIADVTAIAPDAQPYVTNTGTNTDPVFHLFIPRGQTGNGIASIAKTGTSGNVDTYTITMTDGTTATFTVTNATSGSISTLSDVTLSNLSNGQILKYNSTTQKWENVNESGGSVALNDLTDVTISSASNGQILKYNSTSGKWENVSVPSETWSSAVSCAVGATSCTITDAAILTTSIIEDYSENASGTKVNVPQITVTTGQAVLSFNALTEATSFKIKIIN